MRADLTLPGLDDALDDPQTIVYLASNGEVWVRHCHPSVCSKSFDGRLITGHVLLGSGLGLQMLIFLEDEAWSLKIGTRPQKGRVAFRPEREAEERA